MPDDSMALAERLVAFLPNMRRFAIALCRSRDTADDLVQAACERALANPGSFEPGTRFDAWIFRILRNLWIDQLRRRRTAGHQEDVDGRADLAAPAAENEAEDRLALQAVARAIGELVMEQREVLLLVSVEGLSYKEAAAVLDIPIGTVMSRLARARRALAEVTGINADAGRSSTTKGVQA